MQVPQYRAVGLKGQRFSIAAPSAQCLLSPTLCPGGIASQCLVTSIHIGLPIVPLLLTSVGHRYFKTKSLSLINQHSFKKSLESGIMAGW